jgi:putative transposase
MSAFYVRLRHFSKSFRLCLTPFLQGPGLPFADVLTEEQIAAAFAAEGVVWGESEGVVYTPAVSLWAFLSQVLHAGELRSCAAAVSRVIVLMMALGRKPGSPDTGAYCRARAKLPEPVLRRLTCDVGNRLEAAMAEEWLWYGRHVKLVDGTTATMPDTPRNQGAYPQHTAQQPGLGFPIVRMVVLLSLATAAVCGAAFGPYAGKETGESALLRSLLNDLNPGDILLGDRCYCSYFLLALASLRKVDSVARLHQRRKTDFRRGLCVGQNDHLVTWHRPQRPDWMDEDTYALIPKTMIVREIKVHVHEPGFRVEEFIVATTLLNPRLYPMAAIAELYHYRWNAELDLRALKQSLALEPLRCKSPEMVRKELWTCWLAYNLIRKVIAQAAGHAGKSPRQISFAGAKQTLAASWDRLSIATPTVLMNWTAVLLAAIASREVGDRPNRVEPRAIKRRPKPHKLLKIPRPQARKELLATGGQRHAG